MAPDANQDSRTSELEAIFRGHAPMVYRTARAVTGSPEDAEDIVQTIFLRLTRGEYATKAASSPKAYLYRAAVNLSLDVLRARQRRTFTHDLDRLESPAPVAGFDGARHHALDAALAQLPPEAVQILTLRYVHGYDDTEIAGLLGTSRGAIALRMFRLRSRLRKLLLYCGGAASHNPQSVNQRRAKAPRNPRSERLSSGARTPDSRAVCHAVRCREAPQSVSDDPWQELARLREEIFLAGGAASGEPCHNRASSVVNGM
jgi:RNA polymerase sigma-70 factor (ECF subfamily)